MGTVQGRVGGSYKGYSINVDVTGSEAQGRIGGKFQGGNLWLHDDGKEITGRVGTKLYSMAINLVRTETGLDGKIGKTCAVELEAIEGGFTGKLGVSLLPRDIVLNWDGEKLSGRIGQDFLGQDLFLQSDDPVDPLLLAAMGCAAYLWFVESAPRGLRLKL